ncbi:MAG TPA: sigma 54-interacting transcriptional regulator [Pirellulales bacterium]
MSLMSHGPAEHDALVGRNARLLEAQRRAEQAAQVDATVLITGASGTGKTTLAKLVHDSGPRRAGPFVAVSCAAIPSTLLEAELFGWQKGAFTGAVGERAGRAEQAHGGTLFLDEIGDLPLELQPKLLTFLQSHEVQRLGGGESKSIDVRVIAATHQSLAERVQKKLFREDLYYRLSVLTLHLPPLAERRDDLDELCRVLLSRIAARSGRPAPTLAPDARAALRRHDWPGNVRELENVLQRSSAFCTAGVIEAADLQLAPSATAPVPSGELNHRLAGLTLAEIERRAIRETLTACRGNKAAAARMLGISEKSIYNKMKRLQMRDVSRSGDSSTHA